MELTDIQVKNLISNILNEGYWGHLPLENDSALDEFGEVAYKNIEEQLKNIEKNWGDKLSVFTYLGVIMYMLQIYNFFYSLKSLDKKFDFTNKINKAIKYIDDEKFINTWENPDEVKEYIKKLPDTIKEILDKNSLGSDNFKKLKVAVPCNEGKNYVNMDVDVREGGRHAVKMTEDEFKQEMIHAYHMYAMEQDKKYKYDLQLTPSPDNFVYSLCYNNRENEKSKYTSALYNDIWNGKYKFDSENVDAYGGIKMSKKGFPYIQCAAGGDWECPVCFFVYFDGNKFRGYVPLKGNAINRNEKHAFSGGGNEPDVKFVQKEFGIDYEEADHMCGDIDYNVDACLEDFLARVEVKGTYKKRDYTKDEERFKEYRKEKIADEKRRGEEAERRRQMNAQENNGEPDGSEELNEVVRNLLNKFIFEVKATADEVYQKYYSNIDRDVFNAAIAADPTAKNGGMGKYTKWILNLVKKGLWKPGDTSETRNCLERFAKIGNKLPKKDIQQYGSVGELYQALQDASGVKTRSEVKGEGAEKVYEDEYWVVIHPKTEEAAIYYGKGTMWCTSSTDAYNSFNDFNEDGPLYIIISKDDPHMKWQFHVESNQFRNIYDTQVDATELDMYGDPDELFKFIQSIDKNFRFFFDIRRKKALRKLNKGVDPNNIFDEVWDINDGFSRVKLNNKWNYIKYNPDKSRYSVLSRRWFDDCYLFYNGFAPVVLNGQEYYIDTNGKLYKQKPTHPVSNNEINEVVRNILNKFVFEDGGGAVSDCGGGLPGVFIADPFKREKDPAYSRPKGDICMNGGFENESKEHKVVKNDKGEVVPEKCTACGEKVGLYIKGEPVYLCSKCGKYYGTMPFKKK